MEKICRSRGEHTPRGRFVVALSSVYSCSMPNHGSSALAFSMATAHAARVLVGITWRRGAIHLGAPYIWGRGIP